MFFFGLQSFSSELGVIDKTQMSSESSKLKKSFLAGYSLKRLHQKAKKLNKKQVAFLKAEKNFGGSTKVGSWISEKIIKDLADLKLKSILYSSYEEDKIKSFFEEIDKAEIEFAKSVSKFADVLAAAYEKTKGVPLD